MATPSIHRQVKRDSVDAVLSAPHAFGESYSDLQDTVVALTTQLRNEHAARLAAALRADSLTAELRELRQRNDRLAAIGGSTAEFAHQVRTPLASALLYAGQLDTSTPKQARFAEKIVTGLNELRRMADDMLGFAAGTRCARQDVNVLELLNDVRETVAGQLSPSTTLAVSVTDEELRMVVNRDAIKGALLNLVSNADQAGKGECNILLHAHRFGESIHVCVTDNGPGITEAVQARLFEPFFTTRSNGTGLGLAVVQAVAAAHNGEVELHTSNLGSSFSIRLPDGRGGAV